MNEQQRIAEEFKARLAALLSEYGIRDISLIGGGSWDAEIDIDIPGIYNENNDVVRPHVNVNLGAYFFVEDYVSNN